MAEWINIVPIIIGVVIIAVAVYLHVIKKTRLDITIVLIVVSFVFITYYHWDSIEIQYRQYTLTLKKDKRDKLYSVLAKYKPIIDERAKARQKEKEISIGSATNTIVPHDEIRQKLVKLKTLLEQTKIERQYSFYDWYYKGAAEYITNNYADAIISFENVLKKAPNDNSISSYAYNYRGAAYANHGKPEKAFEDYNKAIKLLPKSPLPYSNIGRYYYYYVKDYEKAFNNLNKASELYINKGNYIWAEDNIAETLSLLENKDINEEIILSVKEKVEQLRKHLVGKDYEVNISHRAKLGG